MIYGYDNHPDLPEAQPASWVCLVWLCGGWYMEKQLYGQHPPPFPARWPWLNAVPVTHVEQSPSSGPWAGQEPPFPLTCSALPRNPCSSAGAASPARSRHSPAASPAIPSFDFTGKLPTSYCIVSLFLLILLAKAQRQIFLLRVHKKYRKLKPYNGKGNSGAILIAGGNSKCHQGSLGRRK